MAEEVGVEMVEEASIEEGEEEDDLGGDGFVVDGGRSPSTSSKEGEDSGVENKSLMGSRLVLFSLGIVKKGRTQEVGVKKKDKNGALFIEEDLS
ncbi:hypothetical protein Tco_1318151 [Tanacetum coccineum]